MVWRYDTGNSMIGIEAINVYCGRASMDVGLLATERKLNQARFANLLMQRKTVTLPWEDPVSYAVNAAKKLIDAMAPADRQQIELLIVATESGVDWGKSISTYVHAALDLPSHCRLFEIKQACYGGTAALQMAAATVAASTRPMRALVIATDLGRPVPYSYAEPSQGSAAVAMLVSAHPHVLALEPGASGVHGYEVMDACRPTPEMETGDADLSLLSYLDCMEKSFLAYQARVPGRDFQDGFDYLACHTPFGGMVKGAHRTMMRKFKRVPPPVIEADFQRRVQPSLRFCQEVGNIYSGTIFLALCGVLAQLEGPARIGLFSYGSGCCSEFYSGTADAGSAAAVTRMGLDAALASRHALTMAEYEAVAARTRDGMIGARTAHIDATGFAPVWDSQFAGRGLLVLDGIENYHRTYRWS
jgi:polyketide biosynthesis 3-hydroxy-3-methylglutaryl-CoA synthase-like enzyme PksG